MGEIDTFENFSRINCRGYCSSNIPSHNVPIFLEKQSIHPIRAKGLERMHLKESLLNFFWVDIPKQIIVHLPYHSTIHMVSHLLDIIRIRRLEKIVKVVNSHRTNSASDV